MHFGSSSDPSETAAAKAKPRYVYLILKQHGQSFRRQVRLLLREAKPSYVFSILKPHSQSFRSPVRLLLSKAKLSYVYWILKPYGQSSRSLVRLLLCEAELCILDFKITWSAKLRIYNLKKTSLPQSRSQAVVCVSTPRMYPRSGYFLVINKAI